jgi:hypothetical protein
MQAVSLLVHIFNVVLGTQHARVISSLKPGKDPAQPSSYRPISLLGAVGKLFENIVLTRILYEVGEHRLLRDEQFGFRPRHSTSPQLAPLVERITRNFGEKRLTGAAFLEVAKAFDTIWIDGLLYKLTILNFPSYLVHTISSSPSGSDIRGVLPDDHVILSRCAGWSGAGWFDLPCHLQPVCRYAHTLLPRRVGPLCG